MVYESSFFPGLNFLHNNTGRNAVSRYACGVGIGGYRQCGVGSFGRPAGDDAQR